MRRPTEGAIRRALLGDFRIAPIRTAVARARGARVLLGRTFRLIGARNVASAPGSLLLAGTGFYGFVDRHARGLIRVRGTLRVLGRVKVASGCRFDVLPGAVMTIGHDTYFSPHVQAVVAESLTIGGGCAIAWDVQFLDDDRHAFRVDGRLRPTSAPIVIGDGVWIGAGAKVFKGVTIADGCVVAAGAIVTRSVLQPNSLIGGSPARVLKTDVHWE